MTEFTPDKKHPTRIRVNLGAAPKERLYQEAAEDTTYAQNTESDGYLQSDIFLGENTRTHAYTSEISTIDTQYKLKIPIYNVYFETGKYDLATADATLEGSQKNDARQKVGVETKKLVDLLKKDPSIHIFIRGHASKTGDAETNRSLSLNRARVVQEELLTQLSRAAPDLVGRVSISPLAVGDRDAPGGENKSDKNVEVYGVSDDKYMEPLRQYRVIHLQAKDFSPMMKRGEFRLNLCGSPALNEAFSESRPIPARGSIMLDALPTSKLPIHVTMQEASDFQCLVADPAASVSYQVNELEQRVTVLVSGKVVSEINYHPTKGGFKPADIHVGKVDPKTGAITPAVRDVAGEAAIRAELIKKIDRDGDGKLTRAEVDQYAANALLRTQIHVADTNGNGALDFMEVKTMAEKLRYGAQGDAFKNIAKDFDNAILQWGHKNVGNVEISAQEIAHAETMDKLFLSLRETLLPPENNSPKGAPGDHKPKGKPRSF